jgi:hypothetical protein
MNLHMKTDYRQSKDPPPPPPHTKFNTLYNKECFSFSWIPYKEI